MCVYAPKRGTPVQTGSSVAGRYTGRPPNWWEGETEELPTTPTTLGPPPGLENQLSWEQRWEHRASERSEEKKAVFEQRATAAAAGGVRTANVKKEVTSPKRAKQRYEDGCAREVPRYAYYHVPLSEATRALTTFWSGEQLFRFRRLPDMRETSFKSSVTGTGHLQQALQGIEKYGASTHEASMKEAKSTRKSEVEEMWKHRLSQTTHRLDPTMQRAVQRASTAKTGAWLSSTPCRLTPDNDVLTGQEFRDGITSPYDTVCRC